MHSFYFSRFELVRWDSFSCFFFYFFFNGKTGRLLVVHGTFRFEFAWGEGRIRATYSNQSKAKAIPKPIYPYFAALCIASYADILCARHAIFLPEDCVTSPQNVCVGGYALHGFHFVCFVLWLVHWAVSGIGSQHQERATILQYYITVYTDRSIFSFNLPRYQTSTEPQSPITSTNLKF